MLETAIAESALAAGVPVYTGEVKIDEFRKLLARWQPDAIASCVFRQVIDAWIIDWLLMEFTTFILPSLRIVTDLDSRLMLTWPHAEPQVAVWTIHEMGGIRGRRTGDSLVAICECCGFDWPAAGQSSSHL